MSEADYGVSDLRAALGISLEQFARDFWYQGIVGLRPYEPLIKIGSMNTNDALYRSICQYPAEDTPRLMYADWLDEFAPSVSPKYRPAYLAHAELIRLQIAVARGPNCPVCQKTGRFRGTHRQWCEHMGIDHTGTDIHPDKSVDNVCTECPYYEHQNRVRSILDTSYHAAPPAGADEKTSMKFPGKSLWQPGVSLHCREVRYVRGFVGLVSMTTASYIAAGPEVVKACPIEMLVLSDKPLRDFAPHTSTPRKPFGRIGYFWAKGSCVDLPNCVIPEDLWNLAYELRDKQDADTHNDCYRWLSYALIWKARKDAGLEPWIPRSDRIPPFKTFTPGMPTHWFDSKGDPYPVTPESLLNADLSALYVEREPTLIHYKGFAAYYEEEAFAPDQQHDARTESPFVMYAGGGALGTYNTPAPFAPNPNNEG